MKGRRRDIHLHVMVTAEELAKYEEVFRSTAHLILRFAQEGGFDNASGF